MSSISVLSEKCVTFSVGSLSSARGWSGIVDLGGVVVSGEMDSLGIFLGCGVVALWCILLVSPGVVLFFYSF